MSSSTHPTLAETFADAGVDGFLHAVDLATGSEIAHQADELVVSASTFKLPVMVELFRQGDAGEFALTDTVTVPSEGRAGGPTGLSAMLDPTTLSWRDLAYMMMFVSDNAATDVICDKVGLDRVEATMKELGLTSTQFPLDCRGIYEQMRVDLEAERWQDIEWGNVGEILPKLRALDPRQTTSTTPRDMTTLLAALWRDQVASPESCDRMRQILRGQVWPHRLASGFPEDDIVTGGKTGTLPSRRNEVGVVTYPDGNHYAVAVYTVEPDAPAKRFATDAAIGRSARVAIDLLRGE